jgi:hypothetical protein
MQQYSNVDYIYAAFILLFGIFMIVSPETLIRKAKYDEERFKAESWIKKTGILFCILGICLGIYFYIELN